VALSRRIHPSAPSDTGAPLRPGQDIALFLLLFFHAAVLADDDYPAGHAATLRAGVYRARTVRQRASSSRAFGFTLPICGYARTLTGPHMRTARLWRRRPFILLGHRLPLHVRYQNNYATPHPILPHRFHAPAFTTVSLLHLTLTTIQDQTTTNIFSVPVYCNDGWTHTSRALLRDPRWTACACQLPLHYPAANATGPATTPCRPPALTPPLSCCGIAVVLYLPAASRRCRHWTQYTDWV